MYVRFKQDENAVSLICSNILDNSVCKWHVLFSAQLFTDSGFVSVIVPDSKLH